MYCIKCGKELKEGNKFCIFCGAEIIPEREEYDVKQPVSDNDSIRMISEPGYPDISDQSGAGGLGLILKVLIVLLVLVLIAGGGFIIYSMLSENGKSLSTQAKSDISEKLETENETAKNAEEKPQTEDIEKDISEKAEKKEGYEEPVNNYSDSTGNEDDIDKEDDSSNDADKEVNSNDEFGLDADTEADYRSALDMDDYGYYSSSRIPKFSFYYPYHLYNKVLKDTSITDSVFGENEEEISFYADDDSSLIFTAVSRTDDASLEEASKYVYEEEKSHIRDVSDISKLKVKDGKGFFIITGWDKENPDNMIYEMARIEKDYIYFMKTLFPDYTGNNEEKNLKSYYTECLYRSCGFSNSTKSPRSYDEYLDEVEN